MVAGRNENPGDRQLIFLKSLSQRHTGDPRLEDEFVVENALVEGDEAASLEFNFLGDDVERVARHDLSPEDGIVATNKTDEPVESGFKTIQHAAALACGFNHQHAGQQRASGEVPRNPELIVTYFLDRDATRTRIINPDDVVELTHIPLLGEVLPDFIRADASLSQIDAAEIDEVFR